jgi:hypothetical protein
MGRNFGLPTLPSFWMEKLFQAFGAVEAGGDHKVIEGKSHVGSLKPTMKDLFLGAVGP